MKKAHYLLYTTANCHLCEEALAMISQFTSADQLKLIEICDCDHLLNEYGVKIPVLKNCLTQQELCWPFNLTDVLAFTKP